MSHHMHHNNWMHIITGLLLLIICLYAVFNTFILKDTTEELEYKADLHLVVKGMTCNHCKETVMEAINSCDGIRDIKINLDSGETFIYGNKLNEQKIITSINEVGFSIGKNI